MGFWGSFLGNAAGHAINEMQREDKENKRWNELFLQLGNYETEFNDYLKQVGIQDLYIGDVEAVNCGNISSEIRKMDNYRKKIDEYIELGGICLFVHSLESIDDDIRKIRYLKSMGCVNRQHEFVDMSISEIEDTLENVRVQNESVKKSLKTEPTDYHVPDIELSVNFKITGVNAWMDDDNLSDATFMLECDNGNINVYGEPDFFLYQVNNEDDTYWNVSVYDVDGVDNKKLVKLADIVYAMDTDDALRFKAFCDKRDEYIDEINMKKQQKIGEICNEILDIDNLTNNLLNIIDEKILLNHDVVIMMQMMWSYYKFRTVKLIDESAINDENFLMAVASVSQSIDTMVEVIQETSQDYDETELKYACWEAIKRNSIKFYSQLWEKRYGKYIDEPLKQCESTEPDGTLDRYIESVISCHEIDDEDAWCVCIFTYYMMDKGYTSGALYYPPYMEIAVQAFSTIRNNMKKNQFKEKLKGNVEKEASHYSIDDVDMMNGNEFEHFVSELYKKMGYNSEVTKQSGDQGLDVIAKRNNITIGIQAKCYSGTVGNSAVQEAVAGKDFYHCDKVVVVTNNFFTQSAIELAQVNDVILWNRDILKEKIKELM